MVPCLKCGHIHEIAWRNVKWDKDATARDVHQTVRYQCPKCEHHMDTHGKNEMIRHGKWEATATGEQGHASFYAPSILSPWVTLEYLAAKWLNAQRDSGDLQDFINSELGEVWSIVNKTTDEKSIVRRRRHYKRGEKAFETLTEYAGNDLERGYILTVDVQKTCFWWVLREWRKDGASAMVDFGRADTWEEVVKLADETDCVCVLVDSGYGVRTSEVYQICVAHRFTPTKGASRRMAMPWTQNTINVFEGTRRQREGESIQLVTYDTIQIKGLLADTIESGEF
jgi:phage terminase large subunit GpA-like protein